MSDDLNYILSCLLLDQNLTLAQANMSALMRRRERLAYMRGVAKKLQLLTPSDQDQYEFGLKMWQLAHKGEPTEQEKAQFDSLGYVCREYWLNWAKAKLGEGGV